MRSCSHLGCLVVGFKPQSFVPHIRSDVENLEAEFRDLGVKATLSLTAEWGKGVANFSPTRGSKERQEGSTSWEYGGCIRVEY